MGTGCSTEICKQCGYEEYYCEANTRSFEECGFCGRCGHKFWTRLLHNKDGTIKKTKNGKWASRYYERKGYGAAGIRPVEGNGCFSFWCFTKPIPQKMIEAVKASIAQGCDGYVAVWNEETKTVEDIVGRCVDFWNNAE